MGYCSYYTNPNGNAVATWIGTGTDSGKSKQIIFLKGSLGSRNKTAACAEARKQFCQLYGKGGECYVPPAPTPSPGEGPGYHIPGSGDVLKDIGDWFQANPQGAMVVAIGGVFLLMMVTTRSR